MKRIYTKILILFVLLLMSFYSKAQIQHLCGNDTIILHLNNYQYGSVQWEKSDDSTAWETIDGAIDTVYKFYPTENKFYRAVNSYADCPVNYSDLFLVSVVTAADAGMDIASSLSEVRLTANMPEGSTGEWSIISGTGGSFDDAANPNSKFSGQTGQSYKLVWNLTNICGTESDTLNVDLILNDYRNNIVYVDTTDTIIRNNILLNGHLDVKFSSPAPTVTDTSVLIFLDDNKYLLKVDSVRTNADTVFMVVSQGSLQDFIKDGVIDFSPLNYETVDSLSRQNNVFPTRKQILNHQFANGQILFSKYQTDESFAKLNSITKTRGNSQTLNLTINPIKIYGDSAGRVALKIGGSINFTPNIVTYARVKLLHLDTMIIAMQNARINYTLVPELEVSGAFNLIDFKREWLLYSHDVLVVVGGVPVWISSDVFIKAVFKLGADDTISIKLTYDYKKDFSAGIYYGQEAQDFKTFQKSFKPIKTIKPEISGSASLSYEFKFGPKFSLKLYNVLSGYIELYPLKETVSACVNSKADWEAGIGLSAELVIGGIGEIFGWEFFNKSKSFSLGDWYSMKFPSDITKEEGDMQKGITLQTLANPLKVRVKGYKTVPLPYVNVHFKALNGSVQDSIIQTDANGYAHTNWTLDNTIGKQYLNAYVNDCNSKIISKTSFTCDASIVIDCHQSTLDITLVINDILKTIQPVAVRGVAPYSYSINGTNYQAQVPVITLTNGTTYNFYVKDTNGCIAHETYTYTEDPCANASIIVNISVDSKLKKIDVTPQGGTPPYQYAYITPSSYSGNNTYTFNSPGFYNVYVKDANNCEASSTITIDSIYSSPGTVTDIDGNIYHTITIGTQTWMVENLKVTRYRNGDIIPNVTDNTQWSVLSTGAWCYYNNDSGYNNPYGKLYNGSAVIDSRNIAPVGWHVPSITECVTLINYVGGLNSQAKLKEAGTVHWASPNDGTNETGFTGVPGGHRRENGYGIALTNVATFFTSTPYDGANIYGWSLDLHNIIYGGMNKVFGCSVRCIKDN